ncbi:MAG TPA: rod shape-determining protein RodA [Acidimicrobiales bacterium]|jgi:rod shape determining protein RodA|nr:rod shape-determining protein RodA [Actinomycetota bacterium]MDP6061825.1 rod shape-determining protein RodA [Acidimicrobiales bacterium]MDP6215313.1 rod shape-determining protein RodA [Acidimicrobiales bacterium]MDP7209827.1 rod shape-determining protein RodA [Acidimicrobiales bacterium]HJL89319.1 rod shape-determining protein RodA [Acidimicrobiales bacterium]|tara:strand:+ start:20771 stop:21916 length:1146 start_codon:yes stop_codon:yes gene_type:complete
MVDIRKPRFDRPTVLRHIDLLLPLLALVIAGVGIVMVYSATRGPATDLRPADTYFLNRQMVYVGIGAAVMLVTSWIGHRWAQRLALPAYLGLLTLLAGVLVIGTEVKGARAWFQFAGYQFQPSEFGKVAVIVALAAWLGGVQEVGAARLGVAVLLVGVPVGAILMQPDLGTILVYGAIAAGMVLVAGVRGRHLLILGLMLVTGMVMVLQSDLLADYQVKRLLVFVDDEANTAASYNLEQAQVAIGNGGLTGTGLFEGTQNISDLVPEQQTDFIFTVVAEETGFVGSALVLGLIALLLARVWRIGRLADDRFGMLIAAGVFSMLLFQVFQSVGMSTGIMPITGIPLPLVSYGGSSILTTFLALGLVESVHMRRHHHKVRSAL